ncbi:MAG: DegT/DnrJ/EryC1/StrS family aminotransferase [Kiritimatiellae bacterium]|nr:DegT/DnrJ/EryC1/StrS family aminotransferase [Kiritimatiellia bacterium]
MKSIYVTSPTLPPLEEFIPYLKEIWDNKRLTNMGPFHNQLEAALAEYFGVKYVSLFCNGTVALQIGLQALKVTGEVITTPFSFPATTHSIYWNRCAPVFCDIDAETYNIDPRKIESLITPETTCILPVHTYGTPCAVDEIQRIADIYGLKVFYDAAHVFGETWRGKSLLGYGDLSMISFHATKVFSTIEGGALISNDAVMKKRIDYLKNFGIADELTVVGPGSNGKMNEVQAAFGLCLLRRMDKALEQRKDVAQRYMDRLSGAKGIRCLQEIDGLTRNWSYFPILVNEALFARSRNAVYDALKKQNIHARKYFYPLISNFPTYRGLPSAGREKLPVAEKTSKSVLCLPMYPDLPGEDVERICGIVLG